MAKKKFKKTGIKEVKIPAGKFEDPEVERKERAKQIRKKGSNTSIIRNRKKVKEKRNYHKVRKNNYNRDVLAVEGTVEQKAIINPRKENLVPETQVKTRSFLTKQEVPLYSPVITASKLDPFLVSELNRVGINFKINQSTIPNSPLMTMSKFKIAKKDLNELGIVVDRLPNDRVALSPYDVLYLLENAHLTDWRKAREIHREMFLFFNSQDPNFVERYMVYQMAKQHGYVVMDGTRYGFDFVIYEEPSSEFLFQLNHISPDMIGPNKKKNPISAYALAGVDVLTRDNTEITVQEVIKGKHLMDRMDMRYFLAEASGHRDSEGHLQLPTGEVKFHGIRLNKLNKKFSPGQDAIILQRENIPEN